MFKVISVTTILTLLVIFTVSNDSRAASSMLNVSATVLSKNTCRFITTTGTLAFGALSLGSPDTSIPATLTFRCQGSTPMATFLITDDDGLYEAGVNGNRMQNTALPGFYLPYELTYTPTSDTVPRLVNQTLSITATIRAASIAPAAVGNYTDTVILSIVP